MAKVLASSALHRDRVGKFAALSVLVLVAVGLQVAVDLGHLHVGVVDLADDPWGSEFREAGGEGAGIEDGVHAGSWAGRSGTVRGPAAFAP